MILGNYLSNNFKAISAILVAMGMIIDFTKKLKFKRKIVLVANGTGVMSRENYSDLTEKMLELKIELVILCVSWGIAIKMHTNNSQRRRF